jgi:hypothetical protein
MSAPGPFTNSRFHDSVLRVRNFMFGDIDKTLMLANNPQIGAPNFLLALGLCCYTEYWGKLKCGIAKNRSQDAFEAFLVELDYQHYDTLKTQIYKDVRCGLAHAYMIENRSSMIDAEHGGSYGIEFDSIKNEYTFFVRTYFKEFRNAVNRYITNLENGTASVVLLETALENKSELL